jgi:hypothetical protein
MNDELADDGTASRAWEIAAGLEALRQDELSRCREWRAKAKAREQHKVGGS